MISPAFRLSGVEEYYFSQKLAEINELILSGKEIINMGIGSPDLLPPKKVVKTLKRSLKDKSAHQYQSYRGIPELRQAMSDFYCQHFNIRLDANTEILPLMGSKEGIMHLSMAYLNPGDDVLIPNPGYPTYAAVTKLLGARPMYYNLSEDNNWLPDLRTLESMDLSKVKIMWINYPHMPTGATAKAEAFEEIVAFAKRHKILVANDNPYSLILNDHPTSFLGTVGAMDVGVELNSLSKTFNMAGWRVGMIVGNTDHINTVLKVKSNMDSGMFYGVQKGAVKALKSGNEWIESGNSIYKKRRKLTWKLADKLNCRVDKNASGIFVWAKLPNGKSDSKSFINSILHEKGVFVAPGSIFGTQGEGYIRFSLCVDKKVIQEAINRFS